MTELPLAYGAFCAAYGWCWQVFSKARAAHATTETGIPHLSGDALLVEKTEAASALIYWNGKRYVWSQQGD